MDIKKTIKVTLNKIKQTLRQREIAKTAPRITKERMVEDLRKLGIQAGDCLFLHSSLKSIGYVEGGANTVFEAIMEVVSSSGTLIVPTYYMVGNVYETCQLEDYVFDPRSAPTVLGRVPSDFLTFPNVQRSIHPTHSVSAVGKHAKYIIEAHHVAASTFGQDSPWDRFLKSDGKLLGLGVTMGPITFYHVLEDSMLDDFPLPVKMKETYRLKCKDWQGNLIEVSVNPLDPEYAKTRIDRRDSTALREYFWQEFTQAGILTVGKVGQATSWVASGRKFYDHLYALMKEGITIYSTPDELQKRPLSGGKY